jgi:hypothetical protein
MGLLANFMAETPITVQSQLAGVVSVCEQVSRYLLLPVEIFGFNFSPSSPALLLVSGGISGKIGDKRCGNSLFSGHCAQWLRVFC